MSRTDVHRPSWVQEKDPFERHRFMRGRWLPNNTKEPIAWPLFNMCGCNLCTGSRGRKYKRRMERAAWRTDRQLLLKGGEPRPPRYRDAWF